MKKYLSIFWQLNKTFPFQTSFISIKIVLIYMKIELIYLKIELIYIKI